MQQSPFDQRQSPKKGFETHHGSRATPRQRYYQKDEDCFDVDLDNIHGKDFDFERNLALFDKRRVLEEIESNQPDVVRLIDHNRRGGSSKHKTTSTVSKSHQTSNTAASAPSGTFAPKTEAKYRNDQNVIASEPTQYNLISVDESASGEYKTDTGLVVPAISHKLRERFMAAAEAKGITRERLVELVARAGTEISLQLLGGSRRLNPQNR